MAVVQALAQLYTERGIQVLVLLSFAMQVALLITAEIRRRKDSGVVRAIVWSAYLMADSTAIYTLGHMSVMSRSTEQQQQQQLMGLWAPFLLVHLGGQDSITAYSMEDNRLWLRHLQGLAVQVAAAAYVIYQSSVVGSSVSLLLCASILVFVVGVVKYGERVWALKCASSDGNSKNYEKEGGATIYPQKTEHMEAEDTEDLLRKAHLLLPVAKVFFNRPMKTRQDEYYCWGARPKDNEKLFTFVEMQLSLMHDLLYSKANVIHAWYGLLIRIISLVSTTASLVLFHRSLLLLQSHHHRHSYSYGYSYSRANVGVTYVLLVGAVILDATSLVRVVFSSWTLTNMEFLRPVVLPLRRLVLPERRRWWSDSMGQHNLFKLYDRRKTSLSSKIARWMRKEELWNAMAHSSRVPVSQKLKRLLVEQLFDYCTGGHRPSSYQHQLCDKEGRGAVYTSMNTEMDTMELDECIVVWHIATQVYLRWFMDKQKNKESEDQPDDDDDDEEQPTTDQTEDEEEPHDPQMLVKAIEAPSNYMLFLLAARPYMLVLPGFSRIRPPYSMLCGALHLKKDDISTDDFLRLLLVYGSALSRWPTHDMPIQDELDIPYSQTLEKGSRLGAYLIGNGLVGTPSDNRINQIAHTLGLSAPTNGEEMQFHDREPDGLNMIALAWAKIMFDAASPLNPDSHCRQLNNGSELLTVAGILKEHAKLRRSRY